MLQFRARVEIVKIRVEKFAVSNVRVTVIGIKKTLFTAGAFVPPRRFRGFLLWTNRLAPKVCNSGTI